MHEFTYVFREPVQLITRTPPEGKSRTDGMHIGEGGCGNPWCRICSTRGDYINDYNYKYPKT